MLALVDTGPIVAYLDRADPAHEFVRSKWEVMVGRFITTAAVATEAMHFLQPIPNGSAALLELLYAGALQIEDTFQIAHLDRAGALISQYQNVPAEFADATLIVLAEQLQTPRIVTLDERGFRTFRYNRVKRFRLLLQDA